jgi:NAD(P)H-dependent FMN reductase
MCEGAPREPDDGLREERTELKIAIILGSTRPGRNGKPVADRVVEQAKSRTAADYELVDLAVSAAAPGRSRATVAE